MCGALDAPWACLWPWAEEIGGSEHMPPFIAIVECMPVVGSRVSRPSNCPLKREVHSFGLLVSSKKANE